MKIKNFFSKVLCIVILFAIEQGYSEQINSTQNNILYSLPQNKIRKIEFFAEALIWNLQQTCNQWAFQVDQRFTTAHALSPFEGTFNANLYQVPFDWSLGLRSGIDYTLDDNHWDIRLYYTWFHTSGSDHLRAEPNTVIQSQFIGSDFLLGFPVAPLLNPIYNEASIKWSISFNMFNLDLGHLCWISKAISFRPFLGIQGGWIDQKIHANWLGTTFNASEKIKHNFWGIGPQLGIKTKWYLGNIKNHSFNFFGDFAPAFLFGDWSFNEIVKTTNHYATQNTLPNRTMGSLVLQGMAGLDWSLSYNCNQSIFSLNIGYEMQIWTEHLQFFQHFSGILHNALTIQGGTVRFLFKF